MINRRNFLSTMTATVAGVAVLPSFDRPSIVTSVGRKPRFVLDGLVRIDKNENPFGPFASARAAINTAMSEAGRYPGAAEAKLVTALAKMHHVDDVNIALGCGSGEILQLCTQYFTTGDRGLVAAAPTFESCGSFASNNLKRKVTSVPVTKDMKLDLDAMVVAAKGAGLVYLCNPNNPTSTVHGAAAVKAFIARVRRDSPQTYILVDEAYHEYVDEPTYATMIPETHDKYVIVSRTFSKVFGMAGLRCGYAVGAPETIGILDNWRLDSDVNQLVAAAALAAISDTAAIRAEQQRNRDVRAYVTKWFTDRKFTVAKSDANFVFIDIKRDVHEVITKCLEKDIAVGRPFPPLLTHLRLSIGLQAEMERALAVLGPILA